MGSVILQSEVLSVAASLADALARGISAPGADEAGRLWMVLVIGGVGALALVGLVRRRALTVPGAGRTIRKALPMLPPDVRMAVATALREHESLLETRDSTPADQPVPDVRRVAVPAAEPPYLFVVRHDRPQAFTSLRDLAWSRPDLLGVVFDRRWMGDRRCKRESGRAERRSSERRRAAPARSWHQLGFLLAAPAVSSRPFPALGARPRPPVDGPARRAEPSVSAARTVSRPPIRPGGGHRRSVLGPVLLLLAVGAGAAAVLYVSPLDRLADVYRTLSSVETPVAPSPAPPPSVAPKPSPPVKAPRGAVVPPPPNPGALRAAGRDPDAAAAAPIAPSEPARVAGVPADQCVTPSPAAVALSRQEVLGPVIGVKVDTTVEPHRCLYVIEREAGVQWVVDSARVELRTP